MSHTIRPANPADVPTILALIRELAEFERLADQCVATEANLHAGLFGPKPVAEALIAEFEAQPAGFALFFHNYSTFLARPGIYLEDLYVRPNLRRHGIGRALLQRLAAIATERNCGRLEWAVLNWNEPAINFYKQLGALPMNEWTVYRLTGQALQDLASK